MARQLFVPNVKCMLGLLVLLLGLLLGGCVSGGKSVDTDEVFLEWPGPPQAPMVRWLNDVHDARDAGISPGFWRRFGELVFGKRQQNIVKPYGIHVDVRGRLSVADPGASVVHLLDLASGRYSVVFETEDGRLKSPIGMTSDDQGTLYLTDSAAGIVYRYDNDEEEFVAFFSENLQRPTGIVFNKNNWLFYVSDTMAHQIVAFGLDGRERFRFGGRGTDKGKLNFPTDLTIDQDGNVVVTDSLNARIQTFSADGRPLQLFGARGYAAGYFDKPKGVALDSDGHIYVCDAIKDAVQVYDRDGRFLFQFGTRGQDSGQFWLPSGIHIAGDDKIYVADSYNQRIQIFQYLKN